jgi:hypothetical protein
MLRLDVARLCAQDSKIKVLCLAKLSSLVETQGLFYKVRRSGHNA